MRSAWIVLTVALSVFLCGDTRAAAQASSQTDDLFLEEPGSGGFYPEDDDDFNSGSGSGAGGEEEEEAPMTTSIVFEEAKTAQPTQTIGKDFIPKVGAVPDRGGSRKDFPRKPITTESPVPVSEDQRISTTGSPGSGPEPVEVHSENLFQRTEVLAAVIAGGVIGFLFAIFLILLLVYRMRKKDEGSYDLGERKPSGAAYQKAPTKEFYA
ncbi:Syndecan-2-B [Oryzias melastigma]|uniref:Syndecan n=1 Tax=Oryzias melastigma TaxID=30732 RepID=A0A3B3D7R9_ORYME|nr:syndecan-2 [Oryzias melastigma]KAF6717564.1 Syndecan-2-B [Oryzias melastigma]